MYFHAYSTAIFDFSPTFSIIFFLGLLLRTMAQVQDIHKPDVQLVNNGTSPQPLTSHDVHVDIEHVDVTDDPRKWSTTRKRVILFAISAAAMITGLGGNLYNPAISEIEADLHASSRQISWSLSLFILFQGCVPILWSALSEVYGRKVVYLLSLTLCTVGCIVAATAKSIGVLIGVRCLQAAGSSAVLSIGAATLADLFDPHERGAIMGIYYCAPLLGPALGPIIGGILTQAFNWRATFWFLTIFTGICLFAFMLFKDTFRRERSLTYQRIARHLRQRAIEHSQRASQTSTLTGDTGVGTEDKEKGKTVSQRASSSSPPLDEDSKEHTHARKDLESQAPPLHQHHHHHHPIPPLNEIKVSLKDVNPIQPMFLVLRRLNNVVTLIASGLYFSFSYSIAYTSARTLSDNYHYDALKVGLVLLSFGVGNLFGSILGGRWSDYVQKKLREKNGGERYAEMRLKSTILAMFILPPSVLGYAWVCNQHVHVAAICVTLFLAGFSSIWIYSSTLAYIVDANVGRSSSAVACNSCFRGTFAFVAAEVAVPLQDSIGDGGMYSLWAGLTLVAEVLLLLVLWKGKSWRERAEENESQ
ncbi:MFS general substrate transporter [Cristinia sonorae]|uniref:MFS general substrate transporter n=1 Tax=Cristinia sonorae TaxID=1940300 RepID=A0A8K0XJU2_9AGAR|nr:MFS general substrate transporter [Cristinia sonorae]